MAALFSPKDLDLLGYEQTTTLRTDAPGWNAYKAKAVLGLETVESTFLYLKADCQSDEARSAAQFLNSQKGRSYVLYPRSLKLATSTIEQIFINQKGQILNLEKLVWERLSKIFRGYTEGLTSGIPRESNYVTPRREGADPHIDLEKELLAYFDGTGSISPGNLLVVKAPAGVGKTTLARHTALSLIQGIEKYKSIPVFVESSHWRKLHLESVGELWEVIQTSLQAFSTSSPISKDLFEYSLRQGYLVFVFDGFDELCGHKNSNFDANQLLSSLAEIAARSEARIVLTTRSLYWDSAISNIPKNASVVELAAFNKQQAIDYLEKRFSGNKSLSKTARELYNHVQGASKNPITQGGGRAQFVNLPLCVVMIAELVAQETDRQIPAAKTPSGNILEDLLLQICDRERSRQNLQTTKEDQLTTFETLVCDKNFLRELNPEFTIADIEFGFLPEDIVNVKSHALLTDAGSGYLKFKYEFLPSYLRALALSRAIFSAIPNVTNENWELMANEANGKGYLLEHLVELVSHLNWRQFLSSLVTQVPSHLPEANSFLFHLARNLLTEGHQKNSKSELTNTLFSVFEKDSGKNKTIKNLTFVGQLHGLSLNGYKIINCSFTDVSFLSTDVDDSTSFEGCKFRGVIDFPETKNWKSVKLVEPRYLDSVSSMCWESLIGQAQSSKIDTVSESVRYALQKFWHNGHFKESLRRNDWNKGPLAHSPYKEDILKEMLHLSILDADEASGVKEGVLIFNRANLPDLQRFMDNRQKTGVVLSLIEHVMKKN